MGVVPLKCFRCILEGQGKLLYTTAALASPRSPMCWHVVLAASLRPSMLPRAFGEDLHLASSPLCLFQ